MADRPTRKKCSLRERIAKRETFRIKKSGTYRRNVAKIRDDFEERVRQHMMELEPTADSSSSNTDNDGPLSDVSIATESSDSESDIVPAEDVVYHSPEEDSVDESDELFGTDFEPIELDSVPENFNAVVLKDFLPEDHYHNFLVLFCATTICSNDYHALCLDVAEALFKYYAECFFNLFKSATSNVHNLTHIVDEVRQFGNLSTLSAYPFENQLYQMKKMLRSGRLPLTQTVNRLSEITASGIFKLTPQKNYPILKYPRKDNYSHFSYIQINDGCTLVANRKDNWFLTQQFEIISMEYAVKNITEIAICGRRVRQKDNFFVTPIASSDLNIFFTTNCSSLRKPILGQIKMYAIDDILCKLCLVSYETKNQTVFIPIHHTYVQNK